MFKYIVGIPIAYAAVSALAMGAAVYYDGIKQQRARRKYEQEQELLKKKRCPILSDEAVHQMILPD